MFKNPALGWLVISLAIITGVLFSLKPWQVYRQQRLATDRQIVEMHDAEKSRADLVRRKLRETTLLGQEEIAREHGYLGKGEVAAD